MVKTQLFTLALLLPAALPASADEATLLVTNLADGTVKGNLLGNQPAITYPDDTYFQVKESGTTWQEAITDVKKYWFCTAFTLNDTTLTSQTVEQGGYKAAKLYRTLTPDVWNTFCVPFSMTGKQVEATFGEGTLLRKYKEADVKNKKLKFEAVTEIEAGVAYMVKPTKENANPVILGITTTTDTPNDGTTSDGYGFHGVFTASAIDSNAYYLTSSGKLGRLSDEGTTMKGMRAYFVIPSTESDPTLFTVSLDEGDPTGISEPPTMKTPLSTKVFNTSGQYVGTTTEGLQKGVYVVNGRKVIIK